MPKFEGSAEERKSTYMNFKFREGYWNQYLNAFTMNNTLYTQESLEPVLDAVGREGVDENLKAVRTGQTLSLAFIVAALGYLLLSDSVRDWDGKDKAIYYGLLGLSVGSNYFGFSFMNSAAKSYNENLRQKLNLGLTAKMEF